MIYVEICVGSSCHLSKSEEIIALFQQAVEEKHLEGDVILIGCFCLGKCNRQGVSVAVNDEVHTGITKENFEAFFQNEIMAKIEG
jgi:NADH:ubiquinone oxidoreductase subunit E